MKVPFFNSYPCESIDNELKSSLLSTYKYWYVLGERLKKFEKLYADFLLLDCFRR